MELLVAAARAELAALIGSTSPRSSRQPRYSVPARGHQLPKAFESVVRLPVGHRKLKVLAATK